MTNIEKYIDELKVIKKRAKEDLLIDKIAVNKQGQPKYCITQPCDDCIFNGHCTLEAKKQWLEQGYVEPEQQVDWSEVKVDTPIYVRDKTSAPWVTAHFAKYEEGKVCSWFGGCTSFTSEAKDDYYSWNYAKLAESEETVWQPLPEYRKEQEDEQ